MNLEKVVFAFFIVLALTVNFGFYIGAQSQIKTDEYKADFQDGKRNNQP